MHGQDQDPGPGRDLFQPPGHLDACQTGHGHIQDRHVGVQLSDLAQTVLAVTGLARHPDSFGGVDQGPQSLAEHLVVIGEKNGDHVGLSWLSRGMSMETRVPLPGSDSMVMVPLMASTHWPMETRPIPLR